MWYRKEFILTLVAVILAIGFLILLVTDAIPFVIDVALTIIMLIVFAGIVVGTIWYWVKGLKKNTHDK